MNIRSIKYGAIVKIVKLKARPQLNDTFAVLLPPETKQERSDLKLKNRVKVSSFPNTLSLRRECINVLSADDIQMIDWSFSNLKLPGDTDCASVLAAIRHPQSTLSLHSECDKFAQTLWNTVAQGVPMPPRQQLTKDMKNMFLNNTAGHHLYFLGLDQIGHHIILETRAGMARMFQSFMKSSTVETSEVMGFSGREWITGEPDSGVTPLLATVLRARKRWNVPNNLHRSEIEQLLDLIFQLQETAAAIADEMVLQLPASIRTQQVAYEAKTHTARSEGKEKHQIEGFLSWAKHLNDNPSHVSSFKVDDATHVVGSDFYQGEPFHFKLPKAQTNSMECAFKDLTGHSTLGVYWIKALLFKDWKTQFATHKLTKTPEAIGWTVMMTTIPH